MCRHGDLNLSPVWPPAHMGGRDLGVAVGPTCISSQGEPSSVLLSSVVGHGFAYACGLVI